MAFEKSGIAVQKVTEYEELKGALERAFAPGSVEKFLKALDRAKVKARDFEGVLAKGLLEKVDELLRRSGQNARRLYEGLTPSDQGLIREFYLVAVEQVDMGLREKYRKIYAYY